MNLAEKVCPICQKPFIPANGRQIYCSKCKPLLARFSGKRRTVEKARNLYLAKEKADFKKSSGLFCAGMRGLQILAAHLRGRTRLSLLA